MKKLLSLFGLIILALFIGYFVRKNIQKTNAKTKLYWLIPDGVRAEPDTFTLYQWAQRGDLPNFKIMMDNGSYGYSIPVFPSHTPVNFAALLSGATPKVNGVSDGPMHTEGQPLNKVSVGGFRSVARKVPAIWSMLESAGRKVAIISTPGSTPPEIEKGIVVRGRWGGWGADVHSVNYESRGDGKLQFQQGRRAKLFTQGPKLVQYVDAKPARGWSLKLDSSVPPVEFEIKDWGGQFFAYVYGSKIDGKEKGYDKILFSHDKKEILDDLKPGDWGKWHPANLKIEDISFLSHVRFHVIRMDKEGFFRVRVLYDNLNNFITSPPQISDDLQASLGPMVDFVDNFPPQLIYYPEDRNTFLDEMGFSFDWHTKAIKEVITRYNPDAVIHDVYNPNQMLTSRWWIQYVDPMGAKFQQASVKERADRFAEVLGMYKRLDTMLGEIIKNSDPDTLVVFSSDHGAHVLNQSVRINNILASKGLLKFTIEPNTGEPIVNWEKSQAVFLQMHGIFLGPQGLSGNWHRSKGADYDQLREKVIQAFGEVRDGDGKSPFGAITKWEEVEDVLELPKDRVGDLILSNNPGYGWTEDMTEDLSFFSVPLEGGYKQAIKKDSTKATWTPFLIMGPGVRKAHSLSAPIKQIDQLPTLLKLMDVEIPETVQGVPVKEIIQ